MRRGIQGGFGLLLTVLLLIQGSAFGARILIPMDDGQKNHLKAYGLTYWVLQNGRKAE